MHTYGAAFHDTTAGRPECEVRYPPGNPGRVLNTKAVPATPLPAAIGHDAAKATLHVGAGEFAPVPVEVWDYDVGGTQVVKKWFSYRKAEPGGKVSSPLDKIHAERWTKDWNDELVELLTVLHRLVELEPRQADLLNRIVNGPLVTVAELTKSGVFPVPPSAGKPHREAASEDAEDRLF